MSLFSLFLLVGCHGLLDPTRVWVEGGAEVKEGPVRLVAGSTLTVTFGRRFSRTLRDTTLISTAPATLAVGAHTPEEDAVVATLTAAAPGDAVLELLRDGEPLATLAVEVRAPDRVTLHPVGPRLFQGELQDAEPRPSLLAGGGSRFLVTWHAGDVPLQGHGAIVAPAQRGLEVYARAGDADTLHHDSIVVRAPSDAGATSVAIAAGGVTLEHPVRLRTPAEVVAIRLDGPSYRDSWLFQQGFVMARALDGAGEVVHGAPVTWRWGAEGFEGEGEVFRFMSGDGARPLRAEFAGHSAEVEASGSGGTVLDVTRACSTAAGGGWLGVGMGLLALGRRRAS